MGLSNDSLESLAIGQPPAVDEAVDAVRRGEMVALEEPAGEGPSNAFLAADARTVSEKTVAAMLMLSHGTPLVALPAERCDALGLKPSSPSQRPDRNFMVNIEAKEGTTTGISAADRAMTMRVASDPESTRGDIVMPGHIVPVRVEKEGVLRRAGAPEAAVDLMILAGSDGGAAMCQILDEDGEAPSPPQLRTFAREHGFPRLRTVDVLDQRLGQERLVSRISRQEVELRFGRFSITTYTEARPGVLHYAIQRYQPRPTDHPVTLRVRTQDPLVDAMGVEGPRAPLAETISALPNDGPALVLYLAPSRKLVEMQCEDPASRIGSELFAAKWRSHVATQILNDLAIKSVNVSE